MARASWKYHFFRKTEVAHYANYLTDYTDELEINTRRHNTITKFNYFLPAVIHLGKWEIERHFMRYHIGYKLGEFTKNRKPYYFRSKKKKNATKKYYLSWPLKFSSNPYT